MVPSFVSFNFLFLFIYIESSPTIECPTQNTATYKARLPTAQEVSDALFQMSNDGVPNASSETTSLQTYFGQFLDHDITLTENAELHCDQS